MAFTGGFNIKSEDDGKKFDEFLKNDGKGI